MTALLLGVVAASFLGSMHCVGMCGPMVCLYAAPSAKVGEASPAAVLLHGAYQLGRLLTLLLLGLLAGGLGTGVDLLGDQVGLQRTVAVAAGVLMIAWGLGALLVGTGRELRLPFGIDAKIGQAFRRIHGLPPLRRAFLVGGLTPFLPCGWLWLFVLVAAGVGHPAGGAAVLAAFWAGNLPALTGLGVGLRAGLKRFQGRLPALSGAVMIVVGGLLLWQRTDDLQLPSVATVKTSTPDPSQPAPCCEEDHESP